MEVKNLQNEYGSIFGVEITLEEGDSYERIGLAHCQTQHMIRDAKGTILYGGVHDDDVWDQVRIRIAPAPSTSAR